MSSFDVPADVSGETGDTGDNNVSLEEAPTVVLPVANPVLEDGAGSAAAYLNSLMPYASTTSN